MGEEVRIRLELNSPGKMYAAGASRISLLGVDMSEVAHVGLELNWPENMLIVAPLGLERQVQRAQLMSGNRRYCASSAKAPARRVTRGRISKVGEGQKSGAAARPPSRTEEGGGGFATALGDLCVGHTGHEGMRETSAPNGQW